jgi:hypothetical protein
MDEGRVEPSEEKKAIRRGAHARMPLMKRLIK